MKTNEKKNTSAKKKLIPAVAMLTTSAVMLSTATYAWFTMSREVEVTGIKLTATTPQTIEISLGRVTDGTVKAPTNKTEDDELWMNSVATGSVYDTFGRLIPASSTDGNTLYYTTNAISLGRDVQFDNTATPFANAMSKPVTVTASGKSESTGDLAASTNDSEDGYYLDIPVWFRTTSSTEVKLGVKATFENTADKTDEKIYKAARVSIIDANTAKSTTGSAGVIASEEAKYYNGDTQAAVKTAGVTETEAYGEVKKVVQCEVNPDKQVTNATAATTVAKVTPVAQGKTGYGDVTQYYIRVWLEGEDEACWNGTASQSFNINLQFYDLSNKAGN
ncbi:hypothetical protein [uncultured Ruminococcus sp.]|uniref:hypothetical protein n=1 Tax=uncultured Ruminococcus sp. TaxID=165186 RepID=UPI0025EABE02|nr:hypothetical protein [uncultured Ruminococcus sp.]